MTADTLDRASCKSVPLRPPSRVMRLSRMGSFHASRLSFMRVLLRRLKRANWRFDRPVWRIDARGVGVATYRAVGPERSYTLVAFAHDLPDALRSDRPYRSSLPLEKVVEIIKGGSGTQFDPQVVAVFLQFIAAKIKSQPTSSAQLLNTQPSKILDSPVSSAVVST